MRVWYRWPRMTSARLEIVDHICEAGTHHNNDIWGMTATATWIMDGATGLSAERIFPHAPSDAAWFSAGGMSVKLPACTPTSRPRAPTPRDYPTHAAGSAAGNAARMRCNTLRVQGASKIVNSGHRARQFF